MGRIRIVLAEGFSRPNRSPPFERVKDAIVFSFQHAPQRMYTTGGWHWACDEFGNVLMLLTDILEFSHIAWPNPHMWTHVTPQPVYKVGQHSFADAKEPEDAHAHSPRKPDMRVPMSSIASMASTSQSSGSQAPIMYSNPWASGRAFPVPPYQWYTTPAQTQAREPRWAGYQDRYQESIIEPNMDPFVSDAPWRHRGARSSREDVPMPDYSSSSSRAISSTTGMSYEHSKHSSMSAPMDDEHYHLLIEALTPTKPPVGTRAPSNTPSTMAILPAAKTTPATQVRKASGHNQGSTLGLRERSQPSSRDVSGSVISPAEKIPSPPKIGASPSANVKSRKEADKEKEKALDKENESTVSTEL